MFSYVAVFVAACGTNCAACTSNSACTTCDDGYFLANGVCAESECVARRIAAGSNNSTEVTKTCSQ